MNVGDDKGKIVTEIIRERKPEVMVELGGYCGYSTILFAEAVRSAGGKHYFSLERSPKFAKVIQELVRIAGLEQFVEVIVGPSNEGIQKLKNNGKLTTIDMMFLDHYKPAYTTDLKLCESLGLIKKGTVGLDIPCSETNLLKIFADSSSRQRNHAGKPSISQIRSKHRTRKKASLDPGKGSRHPELPREVCSTIRRRRGSQHRNYRESKFDL